LHAWDVTLKEQEQASVHNSLHVNNYPSFAL